MYLELTGVRKMYDEDNGVKQIDLAVEKGMLLTLLGPSGCGKTTLLNLLGGFLKPDAGSIFLDGGDYFLCAGGTPGVYSLSELCSVSAHECPGKCVLWSALFSPDEETGRSTCGREIS